MPQATLIGYRGVGKTSVASGLAEMLGCGWCDCDVELERRLGRTIAQIIAADGEAAFRDAEQRLLAELLPEFEGVVATGGGVVLREANREQLATHGPARWSGSRQTPPPFVSGLPPTRRPPRGGPV